MPAPSIRPFSRGRRCALRSCKLRSPRSEGENRPRTPPEKSKCQELIMFCDRFSALVLHCWPHATRAEEISFLYVVTSFVKNTFKKHSATDQRLRRVSHQSNRPLIHQTMGQSLERKSDSIHSMETLSFEKKPKAIKK